MLRPERSHAIDHTDDRTDLGRADAIAASPH